MGWYLPKTAPRESPFFCNTHPDFVRELASSAVDRIFMPGDCVVNEGHRPWTREDGLDQIPNFQGGSSHHPGTIWKGDEMMRKNAGADLKYRI